MQNSNFKLQITTFEHLHHANFVWARIDDLANLKTILAEAGFITQANPDYFERIYANFGIDEARELSKWAIGKSITGDRKIAVVVADSITHEAQNALLKVFEEPTEGTYFFVLLPNYGDLLGTVLSRVRVYSGIGDTLRVAKNNFLKLPLREKMNFIKKLSADKDKDPLRDLIKTLPENLISEDGLGISKKVLIAKKLVSSRGASPKMLLEWLASYV